MKLSVIIVSYNVRNFLEQCLHSVIKAASGIESEVLVVDNNSEDHSAEMVSGNFPEIKLISNKKNLGFSKANNQALTEAKGEYVLFLNPDTLVEEETFKVCIEFMDSHPGAGAMGVKMTDGKGRFLPESKRSVPTPLVAFYKISGLTALFPRSRRFGKYYLGHLDKNKIHEIEVLTGAFFFARREALDRVGWFDEDFFMYGEDIDLSCRLKQNNYSVYYHPGTGIIHYKGESTRKSSINYVLIFYRAMAIYARKHFNLPGTFLLQFLLFLAIYFRAGLSIVRRVIGRTLIPVTDAAIILAGSISIPTTWESRLFSPGGGYPSENQAVLISAMIIIWLTSIYLTGGYRYPPKIIPALKGALYGGMAILLIYAMLSEKWYMKTATILPLTLWVALGASMTRIISSFLISRSNR
ncbi:MAG: glycosyltransferase [Bacteroidales bacterium]